VIIKYSKWTLQFWDKLEHHLAKFTAELFICEVNFIVLAALPLGWMLWTHEVATNMFSVNFSYYDLFYNAL